MRTFVLILLTVHLVGAQTEAPENLIEWKPAVYLTWDDFKGKPDLSSSGDASTRGILSYDAKYENDSLIITLTCHFDKSISWVKEDSRNDYLLQHEQLHFDLFEVYARRIRKQLLDADLTIRDMQKKIEKIFTSTYAECKKDQDLYDKETDHSRDTKAQKLWNKKIESEIKKLDNYSIARLARTVSFE